MTQSRRPCRQAFTLIELLVVIAIIAIVAGLITAGVMSILWKRPEAADLKELKSLEQALGKFYAKHGCYPPDTVKLCHTLTDYDPSKGLDVESINILTKIWPSIFKSGQPIPWCGYDRTNWNMIQLPTNAAAGGKRCVVLQGDQCLVLFLGGAWGVVGFSDSSNYPIHDPHKDNPFWKGSVPSRTVYYEFPVSRLKSLYALNPASPNAPFMPPNASVEPSTGVERDFPSFLDNFEKQPFVYFVGGNKRTYNVFASPMGQRLKSDAATVVDLGNVQPYFEPGGTASRPKYLNPDSFQLICAGKDSKFGPLGGPWQNGASASPNSDWKDNLANFHPVRLGVER